MNTKLHILDIEIKKTKKGDDYAIVKAIPATNYTCFDMDWLASVKKFDVVEADVWTKEVEGKKFNNMKAPSEKNNVPF